MSRPDRFQNARAWLAIRKDASTNEKQLVYGVVLEPETVDSQGDIYSAPEIEAASHRFMADYQNVGDMHKALINDGAEIVESYIAPCDFEMGGQPVKKGTWVICMHVKSERLWQLVKAGEYTGFSIGGYAKRVPLR